MNTDITPDDTAKPTFTDIETASTKRKGTRPTHRSYEILLLTNGIALEDIDDSNVNMLITFDSGRTVLDGHVKIKRLRYMYQGRSEGSFSDAARIGFEPIKGDDFLVCDEIVVDSYVTS